VAQIADTSLTRAGGEAGGGQTEHSKNGSLDGEEDVVKERQRYIKFIAGDRSSGANAQLSQIIELPRDLEPMPTSRSGIDGAVFIRWSHTPLVDMASYLGLTNESAERARRAF
jgi:chemotaxis signal transduction protein